MRGLVLRKMGGFVALVGGVMGAVAAVFVLISGGMGAGFAPQEAGVFIGYGWVLFAASLLTVVFATLAITGAGKIPGLVLTVCGLLSVVFAGQLAIGVLVLGCVGGMLAFLGQVKMDREADVLL